MVTFFLGGSFSLEGALEKVGLPRRDQAGHVGAYKVGTQSTGQNDLKMLMALYFPVMGRTLAQEAKDLSSGPSSATF